MHFDAIEGTTYWLALDTATGATAPVRLDLAAFTGGPPNDHLADAAPVPRELPADILATNVGATPEPGEPAHGPTSAAASVWFRWTSPESGPVAIDTCGSGFDTVLAVYRSSAADPAMGDLAPVGSDDDGCGRQSRVTIPATAGETYWIAIDGYLGLEGSISLALAVDPRSVNDDATNAEVLPGDLPLTIAGDTTDATRQPGEAAHNGVPSEGGSVWYRWTAAASGPVVLDSCDGELDPAVAVYTGDPLASPTRVHGAYRTCAASFWGVGDRVTWQAQAGVTYWLAVEGSFDADRILESGPFTLKLRPGSPPANDDRADATVVGALPFTVRSSNHDATAEAGEPFHAGGTGRTSLWYRWTADATGAVVVDTCATGGSSGIPRPIDTELAVYTEEGAALAPVADSDTGCSPWHGELAFRAVAGRTYWIAVDSGDSGRGEFVLRVERGPTNGFYEDRTELTGPMPITAHETLMPWRQHIDDTVAWFSWTPTVSGPYTADTCGSGTESSILEVATGDSEAELDWLPTTSRCARHGSVTFEALAGVAYTLRLSGDPGPVEIVLRAAGSAPANDAFAAAQQLPSRLPIAVVGTTVGATREVGEGASTQEPSTIWYRWTPARSGLVFVEVDDSFANHVRVFTGDDLDDLTSVEDRYGTLDRRYRVVQFEAIAGRTYRVQVTSDAGQQEAVRLTLRRAVPPPNDAWANARVLRGALPLTAAGPPSTPHLKRASHPTATRPTASARRCGTGGPHRPTGGTPWTPAGRRRRWCSPSTPGPASTRSTT